MNVPFLETGLGETPRYKTMSYINNDDYSLRTVRIVRYMGSLGYGEHTHLISVIL